MRRLITAAMAAALVATLAVPAAMAGQERVPVCHLNDLGGFQRIEIAEPAYVSHISHGDGSIHGPVPGQPGYVFDTTCTPEPILVRITTLDANGTPRLVVQWEDKNLDGEPSVGDLIRTGGFPSLTGSLPWDYVPARVTEFPVTSIQSAGKSVGTWPPYPVSFHMYAYSGWQRRFQIGKHSYLEYYNEIFFTTPPIPGYPIDPYYGSSANDSTQGDKAETDTTLLSSASPSSPDRPPLTHGSGSWEYDLLQIELCW